MGQKSRPKRKFRTDGQTDNFGNHTHTETMCLHSFNEILFPFNHVKYSLGINLGSLRLKQLLDVYVMICKPHVNKQLLDVYGMICKPHVNKQLLDVMA